MSRIAELRDEKGLTQREVAAELGVDVSTVRNWEKSRDGIKMFARVARLCRLFGCDPEDLYKEDEEGVE